MAYNVPSNYSTANFSFGPGVLYVGLAGATPTTSVGAVRSGGTLNITRTLLDVFQGSPRTLVATYVTQEDVTVSFTSIEWKLQNFQYALGAGEITGSTLSFGGDMSMLDLAVRVIHNRPNGATVTIDLWKARGNGEISTNFGDDLHEFPFTFTALEAATDWTGASLPDKKKKVKITVT